MTLRVGSLFTGLGGLDLGLPGEPAWMCEYDKHARRVLGHRFPGVPVYPDVRELDDTVPPVDMLIGGYPCQPFSVAGKREAEADPRHLWPEFARLIRVLRPRYVFAENVSGHLALGFDRVLCDLAEAGFDAEWVVVRASDIGAPHRRERLFILAADANFGRREQHLASVGRFPVASASDASSPDSDGEGWQGIGEQPASASLTGATNGHRAPTRPEWGVYATAIRRWEHNLGRPAPSPTDDRGRLMPAFSEWMMGLPEGWVTDTDTSRTQQLRMIGNAVVPHQAALAWSILKEAMS